MIGKFVICCGVVPYKICKKARRAVNVGILFIKLLYFFCNGLICAVKNNGVAHGQYKRICEEGKKAVFTAVFTFKKISAVKKIGLAFFGNDIVAVPSYCKRGYSFAAFGELFINGEQLVRFLEKTDMQQKISLVDGVCVVHSLKQSVNVIAQTVGKVVGKLVASAHHYVGQIAFIPYFFSPEAVRRFGFEFAKLPEKLITLFSHGKCNVGDKPAAEIFVLVISNHFEPPKNNVCIII